MAANKIPGPDVLESVGHELKENPSTILASTRRNFGPKRALAQERAIMFNKARRKAGTAVPKAPGMLAQPRGV